MRRMVLALAASCFVAACYSPNIGSGRLACSAQGSCPSGFQCQSDGFCWKPGDADAGIGGGPGGGPAGGPGATDAGTGFVRVAGSLTSSGGAMRSPSYQMVGHIGPAEMSGSHVSNSYRMLDGISGQTKGR